MFCINSSQLCPHCVSHLHTKAMKKTCVLIVSATVLWNMRNMPCVKQEDKVCVKKLNNKPYVPFTNLLWLKDSYHSIISGQSDNYWYCWYCHWYLHSCNKIFLDSCQLQWVTKHRFSHVLLQTFLPVSSFLSVPFSQFLLVSSFQSVPSRQFLQVSSFQ